MGFPEQKIDHVCSADLLTLLAEEAPLSSSLKSMRTRRLKRAEDAQLWSAAYEAAVSCVGEREEPPGSHRCDFTEWYGVLGPWCVMFVAWCFDQAGAAGLEPGRPYSYLPHLPPRGPRRAGPPSP